MRRSGERRATPGLDAITLLGFGAVVLMAGSNVVAVRFSNRELDPFWGAGLRFGVAAVLLLVVVRVAGLAWPRGRALAGAVMYGALSFGAFFALGYWGLVTVPAGIASLLLASVPLLTLLLAWLHGVERLRVRGLVGATVALGGIAIMFASPITTGLPIAALLALLGASVCAAEATVLIKLFPSSHPITTNAIGMTTGAVMLLALSIAAGEAWRLPTLPEVRIAVGYLVVFGSFGLFVTYLFVLKRWTASGVSYQFVLMPIVAIALSAWLDGERLGPGLFAGGLLVLLGVYVGALSRPRSTRAAGAAGRP